MLKELIEQGYGTELNLNCAEKILYCANEVYNLGLDREALKLASGFGGGMAIESTCGALAGGIMVLGKLFKPNSENEKEQFRSIVKEFLEAYKADMEEIDCSPLKEKFRKDDNCNIIIEKAAEHLELIIKREMNPRNQEV